MQQQYYLGYEIKAVSNLMRRKIWSLGEGHQEMLPEIEGVVLGFLCHNQEQNIYQKDLEKTCCLRHLEDGGFIERRMGSEDARMKRVVATPKAVALNSRLEQRIDAMEVLLTKGLSQEELDQFMATLAKLKQNLM